LYLSFAQSPSNALNLIVRAGGSGAALDAPIRQALTGIDRNQPVTMASLSDLIGESVAVPRFRGMLLGFFAGIALLLAIVGIYGVVSYRVTQRTREIGVRLALGARRRDIVLLILRQGMVLAGTGVAIGLAGSLWSTRLLQGMLYQVTTTDAVTFAVVPLAIVLTALFSNLVPARRAARVDPVIAIQSE
jgi:ABC-type antimicrobial peptide transport system permease subunit